MGERKIGRQPRQRERKRERERSWKKLGRRMKVSRACREGAALEGLKGGQVKIRGWTYRPSEEWLAWRRVITRRNLKMDRHTHTHTHTHTRPDKLESARPRARARLLSVRVSYFSHLSLCLSRPEPESRFARLSLTPKQKFQKYRRSNWDIDGPCEIEQ